LDDVLVRGAMNSNVSQAVLEGDVQAAVAALHFVLLGAAKHDVEEGALAQELEQLGVPKVRRCRLSW